VADPKDELPDFDDLKLPEDEFFAAEPAAETTLPESTDAEPLAIEGPRAELEETEAVEEKAERRAEEAETEKKLKKKKQPKKEKPPKQKRPPREKRPPNETAARLLGSLRHANPYTVMLGMALLALLIAVFCLLMELGRYGFHVKASSARRGAFVEAAVQSGPAKTIAAA